MDQVAATPTSDKQRDRHLARLEHQIAQIDRVFENYQTERAAHLQHIANLEQHVMNLETHIANLDRHIANLEAERALYLPSVPV